MSYKLENITFMNKKAPINSVNFVAQKSQTTNLFIHDKKKIKFVKRILKGKEKIAQGRYTIDGQDLVGSRFVKSKMEFITTDKFLNRLVPPKIILNLSLLFDMNFLRQARIKKNDKLYDYLSFSASNNDLSDMDLRRQIDLTVNQFINDVTEAETKLLNDYFEKISLLDFDRSKKVFKNYYVQIQVLGKELSRVREEIATKELLLTFFQALWDKIYSFNELRNSCPCEYNVKKSSNKEMKKNLKKFTYNQPHYMIIKQLKLINIRTSELRLEIYRAKKLMRRVSKQLNIEIRKFHNFNQTPKEKQVELTMEINEWKKFNSDLKLKFEKEQKEIFFKLLPQEGNVVAKRIIYLTHEYHTKVLSGSNKNGNKNEFKILKKHYKEDVVSVYNQARQWTKENLDKLDIKFDWYIKNGLKISSINSIYLKILKAINLQRKNIVFSNVLNLLTKADNQSLQKTLRKINKEYPELTFIVLTDNIQSVPDFSKPLYSINHDGNIDHTTPTKLYQKDSQNVRENSFYATNVLNYKKIENGIEIADKIWNIGHKDFKISGKIFINPFAVSLEEEKNSFPITLKIKNSNRFIDKNVYFGTNKLGQRIHFHSAKKLDVGKEVTIYIKPGSIAEIF